MNIVDSTFINLHQHFLRKNCRSPPSSPAPAVALPRRRAGAAEQRPHTQSRRAAAARAAASAPRQHAARGSRLSSHARSSRCIRQLAAARGRWDGGSARQAGRRRTVRKKEGGRRIGLRRSNECDSLHESQIIEGGEEKILWKISRISVFFLFRIPVERNLGFGRPAFSSYWT